MLLLPSLIAELGICRHTLESIHSRKYCQSLVPSKRCFTDLNIYFEVKAERSQKHDFNANDHANDLQEKKIAQLAKMPRFQKDLREQTSVIDTKEYFFFKEEIYNKLVERVTYPCDKIISQMHANHEGDTLTSCFLPLW